MGILGPWFLNLLISVCFTSISVFLFIKTDFEFMIYYDLLTIILMILSIILIMDFLRRMSFGLLPKLSSPLVIPHPTYICTLVLTLTVTLGYGYIFVYKLALYGCDRAVEARDPLQMTLDSILRLTIALYSLVSFIYIIQRAHVGSVKTKIDLLTRNFINCVFGIIWMRFVMLKAYFTIEQFCRDQIEMMSIVKAFCPPYIKKGFNCTTVSLRKEQMIWYRVHYGLLKSVVVTAASEFIPVLLVAHWYFKLIFIKNLKFYVGMW
uniref:Uncharacterized protein n=1 Tax=Meloidogyne enterolobii TaxID=390850 RepID=A0A6V7TTW4_MELEN|nr:unnamed protein product [Meloidogyne enterolobii]